jgi:hypothetical protein
MKRCVACQRGDLRESREAVEVRVPSSPDALVVRVTGVLASKCGACGKSVLNGPDLGRAELLAGAEAMARWPFSQREMVSDDTSSSAPPSAASGTRSRTSCPTGSTAPTRPSIA